MKAVLALFLATTFLTAGSSQTLPIRFGKPFKSPNLRIEWKPGSTNLPSSAWTYRLLPRQFSSAAISNLMCAGDLTSKDQVRSEPGTLLFQKPDGSSHLWIDPKLGEIQFERSRQYGPTNLAVEVPKMNELLQLTTNFMASVGIPISEVDRKSDGTPDFHFWEPLTMFTEGKTIITNIAFRGARFRRSVDGGSFVGNGVGGDCDLQFGERGVVSRVWMTWRNMERQQEFKIEKPDKIGEWIRKGQALQGRTRIDAAPIDWKTARLLTILDSKVCYYGGDRQKPSDRLIPFGAVWATVETGSEITELEIECPIINEAQP